MMGDQTDKQSRGNGLAASRLRVMTQLGLGADAPSSGRVLPGGLACKCQELEDRVPFEVIEARLRPSYYTAHCGRPPYCLMTMVRVYFIQLRLNLTSREMEAYIHDCPAIMRYARIAPGAAVPDHTTIHRFEQFMMTDDIAAALLLDSVEYLRRAEVLDERFHIVDSSVNQSAKSVANKTGGRDPSMGQTWKGGGWRQGSKLHVKVSANGCACDCRETAANVSDAVVGRALATGEENGLMADRGYASAAFRGFLAKNRVLDLVMAKRKSKDDVLTPEQKQANRQISRLRAVVEHPFAFIKHVCGYRKIRIWGVARAGMKHKNYLTLWNYHRFGRQAAAFYASV